MQIGRVGQGALLARLRLLAAEAARPALVPQGPEQAGGASFASLLKGSLEQVNRLQAHAEQVGAAFERGDPQVSLGEVMVAVQKAGIAFEAATEVRNRLIQAYQDVMNMPV